MARINERRVVGYFSALMNLAVLPQWWPIFRAMYNTQLRVNMETLLGAALKSQALDSTTAFSRIHISPCLYGLSLGADSPKSVDCAVLEEAVRQLARPWEEELIEVISGQMAQASILIEQFSQAFSPAYQASFTPADALGHIQILQAQTDEPLRLAITKHSAQWVFTLFNNGASLALSDVSAILEHLGLRVLGEHSYLITPNSQGAEQGFICINLMCSRCLLAT